MGAPRDVADPQGLTPNTSIKHYRAARHVEAAALPTIYAFGAFIRVLHKAL